MKRYRLWEDPMTALTRAAHHEMKEFPDGDWVRQEDVEALQALNAEMLEALESFLYPDNPDDWQDALIEQIPRLRAIVTKSKGER